MYLDKAIEEDTNMVESWKGPGDAEGMLVFVRHCVFRLPPILLYIT